VVRTIAILSLEVAVNDHALASSLYRSAHLQEKPEQMFEVEIAPLAILIDSETIDVLGYEEGDTVLSNVGILQMHDVWVVFWRSEQPVPA
jgi:hypothetical protein